LTNLPIDGAFLRRFPPDSHRASRFVTPMSHFVFGDDFHPEKHPTRRDFINFYGPKGAIPSYGFWQILDEGSPPPVSAFKDKFVIVGRRLTAPTDNVLTETFLTPFNSNTFGMEIHATIVGNLIEQNWIRRFSPSTERFFLFMLAGILTYALLSLRPFWTGASFLIAVIAGWLVFSFSMFLAGYFVPGALVVVQMLFVFLFSTMRYYKWAQNMQKLLGIKVDV